MDALVAFCTADNLIFLLQGAGKSLLLAACALFFGLILGVLGAAAKISKHKILRLIGNVYVELIRGTPMLLQILFLYIAFPLLMRSITGERFIPDPYVCGAIAMSINSGAYSTELIRSGIMGVDKGQWEACEVLGLNYTQTMKLIILPQAFKRKQKEKSLVFAEGCSFHKLVWLFFIGAFLGDITETIFCRITAGIWMSRSSVLYGPFSIVWGIGVVVLTMMLHKYRDKDDRYIFIFGTIVGGAYEYICSVFTELVFGTVFWDYSKIPFNLGGRINLLYCFFWGLASVLWIKNVYPFLSKWIEKIPKKAGAILSWLFLAFMAVNIVLSAMALGRYSDRYAGKPAENSVESFLDSHYPDERMERVYPNAIIKE